MRCDKRLHIARYRSGKNAVSQRKLNGAVSNCKRTKSRMRDERAKKMASAFLLPLVANNVEAAVTVTVAAEGERE